MPRIAKHTTTNSERQCYNSCQFKWALRYGLGIRPENNSDALVFGTLFHTAMEAWWSVSDGRVGHALEAIRQPLADIKDKESCGFHLSDDSFSPVSKADEWYEMLKAMVIGYEWKWGGDRCKVKLLSNEATLEAATQTPSGKRSPWARYSGVVDKAIEDEHKQVWILDHKTTSLNLKQWRSMNQYNPQALTYAWLYRETHGREPVGICYDLARKAVPAKSSAYKLKKDGSLSHKMPRNADSQGLRNALQSHSLGVDDWCATKLIELKEREDSGYFFRREWIRWNSMDLDRIGSELYAVATQIRQGHDKTEAGRTHLKSWGDNWRLVAPQVINDLAFMFPRQDSCYSYNRPCSYLELCRVACDQHETEHLLQDYRLADRIHEETTTPIIEILIWNVVSGSFRIQDSDILWTVSGDVVVNGTMSTCMRVGRLGSRYALTVNGDIDRPFKFPKALANRIYKIHEETKPKEETS